ncbi:MAG: hypothetical protein JWO42_2204 [Chloroflexi bacterium]|nr:hypothetical protein [Chloroflexota bacterium]
MCRLQISNTLYLATHLTIHQLQADLCTLPVVAGQPPWPPIGCRQTSVLLSILAVRVKHARPQ